MSILSQIRARFHPALAARVPDAAPLAEMIQPAQEAKFGDFQANFAMSLGKQLGLPPRKIAEQIVAEVNLDDLCHPPEIAGPGFINLRLRDAALAAATARAFADERLGIAPVARPKTIVIDYSAPNIAKTMHVGHIRSTVIGDALYRILKFLGHTAIGDNHVGDWGTQFGMIIYGYRHFVDPAAYAADPLRELNRIYRLVRKMIDFHEGQEELPKLMERSAHLAAVWKEKQAAPPGPEKDAAKKAAKALEKLERQMSEADEEVESLRRKLREIESDKPLLKRIYEHATIGEAVLAETAKLHQGDAANLALWKEIVAACRGDVDRIYRRLGVTFDFEYGESFYQPRLAAVVAELESKGLARESDGATCVFLDGFDAPMIVRKRDGAFLYSTTDLATIQFREATWQPDIILYVVDSRQADHFAKLFAAARAWGYTRPDFRHVSFGTVLGEDGKPYKTRSGDTVGLEGLLDEAVERARQVVAENSADLPADEQQRVAQIVGIGAVKYADLSQSRTSDYVFSYDKMLALNGNTAAYMQYAYARVRSIFRRGNVAPEALRAAPPPILLESPAERALAIEILRLADVLDDVLVDYRPNLLTNYLFDLSKRYSTFFEQCPVLKAETPELRDSRLALCDLTARTLRQGLALLGIDVVERM